VLAAKPLGTGGEPLRRATPARFSGAPEKELLISPFYIDIMVKPASQLRRPHRFLFPLF